eukprot:TRINITY_DN2850_c0_g3_i1.p1 TRINITY_DN2850_c0_g3~~TRINITY_DN2850_c0_g3_i1.p1  ORF type:complete len:462 (+),score=62.66 TRINITY_DN2850_c0_g3_i1:55-1440(+)
MFAANRCGLSKRNWNKSRRPKCAPMSIPDRVERAATPCRKRDASGACGKLNCRCEQEEAAEKSCEDEPWSSPIPPIPPPPEMPPVACLERGERRFDGWWCKCDSEKLLGNLMQPLQSLAQQCLRSVHAPQTTTLRVLSLSDGNVNDGYNLVPTSVMLAHAFASLDLNEWPPGVARVEIIGADVQNPGQDVKLQTEYCWPPWLELQHVCLDNLKNFKPQLDKIGQGHSKFDVILMRQGLCYCEDHSFWTLPPKQLNVSGVRGDGSSEGPSGTYDLELHLVNGRPSYRKGEFYLHWRPDNSDWVVEEDHVNYIWANVVKDCGNPALANSPWYAWDGKDYVIDWEVSCEVLDPYPPWRRRPHDCKCCGGIALNASSLRCFMKRVAAALDDHQPKSFALLHSGYYRGTEHEVEELHLEIERAVELFNSSSPSVLASSIRRQDEPAWATSYWNRIDGILLSANCAE